MANSRCYVNDEMSSTFIALCVALGGEIGQSAGADPGGRVPPEIFMIDYYCFVRGICNIPIPHLCRLKTGLLTNKCIFLLFKETYFHSKKLNRSLQP